MPSSDERLSENQAVIVVTPQEFETETISSMTRESVSTVTDGLTFALNTAKVMTEFGFATAKFATTTSINVAKTVVDTVGANTGLDATGITPIISGTLSIADKISIAGIGVGEFFTNISLQAASKSIYGIGNVFGNTEMNIAIQEFAGLVRREFERELDYEPDVLDEIALTESASSTAIATRNKKSLREIGTLEIIKSLTAWICLQRMVIEHNNARRIASCGESLLPLISQSSRQHYAEENLVGVDTTGPIIEELESDHDIVIDQDSRSINTSLLLGHVGTDSIITQKFDILTTNRLFQNIRRYARFATGSYGKMAISVLAPASITFQDQLQDARNRRSSESAGNGHAFFSAYTARPLPTIFHTTDHNQKATENHLLQNVSSSVPRFLPENTTHYQPTFYLILDHPNKSVVLALRGTLSFHDLLVDLSCEYSEVQINSREYLVHQGIQNAAERVTLPAEKWLAAVASQTQAPSQSDLPNIFKTDPTPPYIFEAVVTALEAHPGYSLITTGHSLGAGLAALVALNWGDSQTGLVKADSGLPLNTRIHCFAYGTPAIVAEIIPPTPTEPKRTTTYATAFDSLVTNIVLGDDFIPNISLGSVRDLFNVVVRMHSEDNLASGLIAKYVARKASMGIIHDNEVSLELSDTIHSKCLTSEKLYPIGRTFWLQKGVDGTKNDVREVFTPVNGMFGNVVFGKDMMGDHVPTLYEDIIRSL